MRPGFLRKDLNGNLTTRITLITYKKYGERVTNKYEIKQSIIGVFRQETQRSYSVLDNSNSP